MLRSVLMLSVLALPALARADDKSDKAAAEKAARGRSDDRLDALEMKLQALLKEIQSLRTDKGESAPRVERKEAIDRLVERKRAAEKPEAAGEKRGAKVVRIGDDGKPIEIELKLEDLRDLEKLKKLGAEQLEKLKEMDHLKKLGAEQLEKMSRLKLEAADLEKLKGLKLDSKDLEKLKEAQLKLTDKAKELAGIELRLSAGKDGKPVVVGTGPGKVARVEEPKDSSGGTHFRVVTGAGGDSNVVHLTRVTYSLNGEQARALAEFLKAFAKASVLETKIEGDKLVVTTTPDVQSTIGQVVALMSGKPTGSRVTTTFGSKYTPSLTIPATPKSSAATPEKASKPAKPGKPTKDKDDDE